MRAIFQIFAAVVFAIALVLFVADGTAMLAANAFVATPLAVTISGLFPGTIENWQTGIQDNLHPLLWEPALTTLLSWPGWAVLGVLGLVLAFLARPPARQRMVDIASY